MNRIMRLADDGKYHIVALSGGKDSTAMALRLHEVEPMAYNYVFTPTGDELPELFEHIKRLSQILGQRIYPISNKSLKQTIKEEDALPNFRMRFCTRIIKIIPYREFLSKLAQHAPVVSHVGLRHDEQGRAGMAYADMNGVEMDFPMRRWKWGEGDVWNYLGKMNVRIPERTDCARCYHQRLGEWWRLWKYHKDTFDDAVRQESEYGHTFRTKGRDTWPVGLKELGEKFEKGHCPPNSRERDLFQHTGSCRVCTL